MSHFTDTLRQSIPLRRSQIPKSTHEVPQDAPKDSGNPNSPAKKQAAAYPLAKLEALWGTIKDHDQPFLDEKCIEDIRCETLELDDNGKYSSEQQPCFFQPLSRKKLREFPINPDINPVWNDAGLRERLARLGDPRQRRDYIAGTNSMSGLMRGMFASYPRKGTQDDSASLMKATGWRGPRGETVFDNTFINTLFYEQNPHGNPVDWWFPMNGYPHAVVTLKLAIAAKEDLLRVEVLTILAIMLTRLNLEHFQRLSNIPVLLFTFLGGQQGRILQAYFDRNKLCIRKSRLYDFSTLDKAERSTEIFLQHMASEAINVEEPL